ncbi:Type 1 glutamine amidotransferase-like domain-containing protein [Flexivirga lutea]
MSEQRDCRLVLLGPQRRPSLDKVVSGLHLDGPFATVTAGWQERELADEELDRHLGGRATNLALWSRRQDVLDRDPEFAAAHRRRAIELTDLQELYLIGVRHTSRALTELRAQVERSERAQRFALSDAEEVLRSLDRRHVERVREINAGFYDATRPHEHPLIAAHRAEVAQLLGDAAAVVITGGHVGELLDALHLFNVVPAGLERVPVIAWSAGAMALTERVVLFNDNASRGPRAPEVYDDGLGLLPGAVVLPAAHQRLHMQNTERMSLMVRRFAPAVCLPLDPGARVDLGPDGSLPGSAQVLDESGNVSTFDAVSGRVGADG